MSSMLAPYTLITGGTFTQVHGDAHYHSSRGLGAPSCKKNKYDLRNLRIGEIGRHP